MTTQPMVPNSSHAVSPQQMVNPSAIFVRGISDESDELERLIKNVTSSGKSNPFVYSVLDTSAAWERVLDELEEIRRDCSSDNWDKTDAVKIESETIENAQEFVERLPNYLPLPEISPEPDGNINLEWYVDRNFVFEISVDRDRNLYYAGRLLGQKISGRKEISDAFPEVLEGHLRQFINR